MEKLRKDMILPRDVSTSHTGSHLVSPDATIAELELKATECERRAVEAQEPLASQLREEAAGYRKWIASLRSGRWTA